jgi:hypothetical protein
MSRPPGDKLVAACGSVARVEYTTQGQQMTSQPKRLRQLELIGAILLEVDRQGFKLISRQDLDAIREAADTLVAAVGQRGGAKTVDTTKASG